MSVKTRAYIYGICLAAMPLAVAYGLVTEDAAPLWVALLGSILVPSLALANIGERGAQGAGKHRADATAAEE